MKKLIVIMGVLFSTMILNAQELDSASHFSDTIPSKMPSSFTLGIPGELQEMPQALVFPNPLQGQIIQVRFDKYVSDGLAYIYITNLNGEIAYSGQIMVSNNSAYIDLLDKQLARGHYIITLIRGVEKVTGKFLVQE